MTDVTVAPASAPNPSPQPAQSEIPVNQNPTSSPNPLGPQAPPAPVGDLKGSEHRTPSRSEAIKAAFDRANNPQSKATRPAEKPDPKAAEAKKGHNQPPEDVPDEKFSLKKRPDEQPRGDRGQFAPRQRVDAQAESAANRGQPGQPDQQGQPGQRLPSHVPYNEPPPRFSEAGKKDWASASENVRADVYRMHQEYGKAYQQYRGAAEAFQPIARYHQMAQEHGTTLDRALSNYTSMEAKLRSDPIAGLDTIVNNLNLKTSDGQRLGLRDIAYHILTQSPEQLTQIQQGNQQQAANYQIGSLHQKIDRLEKQNEAMQYRQQFAYTRSAIDVFADSHPRFDELSDFIKQELNFGFDLETAYQRAERLVPATHAAQTRTAPAQTRSVDRSIHGSPDVAPSNGASRKPQKASASPRDAVQNAMNRLGGMH